MGGITGFIASTGVPEVGEVDLRRALATLRHRGPDSRDTWIGGPQVALGYTWMAAQGLDGSGPPRILSSDGRHAMVLDGEIYNASELHSELSALGHDVRGSLADVLFAAFRQWGAAEAAKRFNGMFAIALWDLHASRLTLVRDRMGLKPLYYGWNGRTLWFGSELKALCAYSHWKPRIDKSALADFFGFGYIVEPRSIYEQVGKLGLGHTMELVRGGQPVLTRYWGALDDFDPQESADEGELADELEALIGDACRRRLVSDVPLGMFLSGGVDSSVAAAISQIGRPPLRTFAIGFDDPRFNEDHHAQEVARHIGTSHLSQVIRDSEAIGALQTWGDLYDEPFGDCSGIPTYLAAKIAAQHVKGVLMADGADELFGSYEPFAGVYRRMHVTPHRSIVKGVARGVAASLPWEHIDDVFARRSASADPQRSTTRRVTQHLRYLREVRARRTPGGMFEHSVKSFYWRGWELDRLLGYDTSATRPTCDGYPGSPEEQMRLWEVEHYTAGAIQAKVDRASMAAGIHVREPLLDPRVVSFALALPERLRLGPLGAKQLLRTVLYRHVPRALIERPKMGFAPPIGRWMSGALKPLLDHFLDAGRVSRQGLFDPEAVRMARQRFVAGDPGADQRVWLLLAFQMWHARWMEERPGVGTNDRPAAPNLHEVSA